MQASNTSQEKESYEHSDGSKVPQDAATGDLTTQPSAVVDEPIHFRTIACILAANLVVLTNVYGLLATGVFAYSISAYYGDTTKVAWLPNVGQVVISVIGPPMALTADIYGRRWPILFCLLGGVIGSIVAATTMNINTVIAGLTIQGLGLAAQPICAAVVSEVVPRRWRAFMQGTINFSAAVGGLIGIFVSGGVYKHNLDGNRVKWIQGFTGILYALTLAVFGLAYKPTENRPIQASRISHHRRLLQIDWIGTILLAAGLVPLLVALTWGGGAYPWSDPHTYGPLIVGLVCFAAFFAYEIWGRDDGLLHHRMFGVGWNTHIALLLVFVEGMLSLAFIVYWNSEDTVIFEHDTFLAGARFSVYIAGFLVSAPIVGILSRVTGDTKTLLVIGFGLFLTAVVGMCTVQPGSGKAVVGYVLIAGIAWSFPLILLITIAQCNVPGELLGLISADMLASRGIGGAVGSSIFTAILNGKSGTKLGSYVAAAVIPLGFDPSNLGFLIGDISAGNIPGALALPGMSLEILGAAGQALAQAWADSYRYVWYTVIPFVVLAIIGVLLVRSPRASFDGRIDAPAEIKTKDVNTVAGEA